ncbi:hypothetical protein L336_1021 [Candidatus Saccharimonas aalborgensis]|jgi:hypothetical protein|uniref:Uncharacterized protein n=2 Tax=Candidatus Saccharimonas aalborgensis TaxID=1332188 RepID=R4PWS6_9BACT|nr:hypothetical protein L336_1021 [Candidatus Saccharimonas aalborgensis]QQS68219.1 MAG: hypothetical protein IPP24_04390 [Candidatus Saccharibacteria bacterium]QQS70542.1 MAG: hypothetical protein IPP92_04395 [Candidatus Saccharibacteria bacterium]
MDMYKTPPYTKIDRKQVSVELSPDDAARLARLGNRAHTAAGVDEAATTADSGGLDLTCVPDTAHVRRTDNTRLPLGPGGIY